MNVKLSTGKANNFEPAPGMTKLLRAAWKAYSGGADLGKYLSDRNKRMKEVGRELLARRAKQVALPAAVAQVAAPVLKKKVGPNEACPCGSGKKFKRCCMGRG